MDTKIAAFATDLSRMAQTTDLGDKAFAVLPQGLAITEAGTDQFIGISVDLPPHTTVAILSEAVRIGSAPLSAALQSVQALAEAGAGPRRRRLMDEAVDHLNDFGTVLLGCHAASAARLRDRPHNELV